MNTFHDLFRQPTRPVDGAFPADRRRELLPRVVERSRKLHLWSAGEPIPCTGQRLLIGVATWSGYDLNLLDLIEEFADGPVRIDVFDVDTCLSPGELDRYIPNVDIGPQTPFAGLWRDGVLVEQASGHQGRLLVARVCGLSPDAVDERLSSIYARK
jgi:hypothetical protein